MIDGYLNDIIKKANYIESDRRVSYLLKVTCFDAYDDELFDYYLSTGFIFSGDGEDITVGIYRQLRKFNFMMYD